MATGSSFGSLDSRIALPFTALLPLDAAPVQIGLLSVSELMLAFVAAMEIGPGSGACRAARS